MVNISALKRNNEPASVCTQPVFILNGVTYYPHYSEALWVPPGAFIQHTNQISKMTDYKVDKKKYLTTEQIREAGGRLANDQLWPRQWLQDWEQWLVEEPVQ